jgi:hypothetical protein
MADIGRQRRRVIKSITRQLARRHELVVESPDHPTLLDGPDILVADRGSLAAIFVLKRSEYRSRPAVLDRLLATRLAFPEGTSCLLVQDFTPPHSVDLRRDFDGEILSEDPTVPLVNPQAPVRVHPEVRQEIDMRRAYLFDLALRSATGQRWRRRHDARGQASGRATHESLDIVRSTPGYLRSRLDEALSGSRGAASLALSLLDRALVIRERPNRRRPTSEIVRKAARITNRLTFRIDGGDVSLIGLGGGVLAVDEITTVRGDPLQTFRAAAVSGLVLVERPSDRMLESLVERISDQYPIG